METAPRPRNKKTADIMIQHKTSNVATVVQEIASGFRADIANMNHAHEAAAYPTMKLSFPATRGNKNNAKTFKKLSGYLAIY